MDEISLKRITIYHEKQSFDEIEMP